MRRPSVKNAAIKSSTESTCYLWAELTQTTSALLTRAAARHHPPPSRLRLGGADFHLGCLRWTLKPLHCTTEELTVQWNRMDDITREWYRGSSCLHWISLRLFPHSDDKKKKAPWDWAGQRSGASAERKSQFTGWSAVKPSWNTSDDISQVTIRPPPKANNFKKYIISAPNSGCQANPVKRRISIKVTGREPACRWSCNLLVGGGCHSNSRDGWSMELPRLMDDTQQHAAEAGGATELRATHHDRSHRRGNYVCWVFPVIASWKIIHAPQSHHQRSAKTIVVVFSTKDEHDAPPHKDFFLQMDWFVDNSTVDLMNNQSNFWRRKWSKHVPASPVGGFPAISAVFLHNCKFDIFEFWTVSGKKKGVTITIILNLIVIGAHCLSLAFHRPNNYST